MARCPVRVPMVSSVAELAVGPAVDEARAALRTVLATPLRRSLGEPRASFDDPPGDPGLFGPGSVTWRVHADTPSMLVGGVSSLLVQLLHPGAMAGVADHSVYEHDPAGRLRRTGTFVAGTTFGSTLTAEALIDSVRRVHRRVVGTRPDGVSYRASDPTLLRWVHIAEHAQFLRAYQLLGPKPLARAEVDRYFAEVAVVARKLGATAVPEDAASVARCFAELRGELAVGDQARRAIHFILEPKSSNPGERMGYAAFAGAAVSIMPDWAAALAGLWQPWPVLVANRMRAHALCRTLRWALGPNELVERSLRRCSAAAVSVA
ncbi:MAG: oxygenase MpaB family protein [Actinomycetota bacterium]|nr:oxygenase MpaB family protein [Actinomycetota bacterium]